LGAEGVSGVRKEGAEGHRGDPLTRREMAASLELLDRFLAQTPALRFRSLTPGGLARSDLTRIGGTGGSGAHAPWSPSSRTPR